MEETKKKILFFFSPLTQSVISTTAFKHTANPHSLNDVIKKRSNTTEQQKNNKTYEETKEPIQNLGIYYACLHMSCNKKIFIDGARYVN